MGLGRERQADISGFHRYVKVAVQRMWAKFGVSAIRELYKTSHPADNPQDLLTEDAVTSVMEGINPRVIGNMRRKLDMSNEEIEEQVRAAVVNLLEQLDT